MLLCAVCEIAEDAAVVRKEGLYTVDVINELQARLRSLPNAQRIPPQDIGMNVILISQYDEPEAVK